MTREPYLIFNEKLYKQVGGVAVGSPLFHMRIVKNWLQKYALHFKPRYYQHYFDDILVLFTLPDN